jgi:biopolymer transport protein ExbD
MKHTHAEDETGHGGNRPWVYFMIDAFFLCTQFFVVTFHVKTDEAVLPRDLPPGVICPVPVTQIEKVRVHVSDENGTTVYRYMTQPGTLQDLELALTRVRTAGRDCTVAVSYEPAVRYGDVLAVFNLCSRLDIRKCGLVRLHGSDAVPGS